jgi:hypothetical protein
MLSRAVFIDPKPPPVDAKKVSTHGLRLTTSAMRPIYDTMSSYDVPWAA